MGLPHNDIAPEPAAPGVTGGTIMRKWKMLGLAIGLVTALALSQLVLVGKMPAGADEKAKAEPALGKGKRAQEFIAAFNKGDAKAVAAFWMPDATYTDQGGSQTKGRRRSRSCTRRSSPRTRGRSSPSSFPRPSC
jgi:hypothetical protein